MAVKGTQFSTIFLQKSIIAMKFVLSNQKFFRNHSVSLQELLSFRQNCPEKFFIRLLTAKMSTINLCKMQKAPERISASGAVQSIFSLQ